MYSCTIDTGVALLRAIVVSVPHTRTVTDKSAKPTELVKPRKINDFVNAVVSAITNVAEDAAALLTRFIFACDSSVNEPGTGSSNILKLSRGQFDVLGVNNDVAAVCKL